MALTPKQRLFVREYLKDRNGGRSYRAAYGVTKGADQLASRLIRNAKVAEAIEKGLARLEAKLEVSAELVLAELTKLGFHTVKIRHGDKLKAIELIGKHFKMFTDVSQLQNPDGSAIAFVQLPANGTESPEHSSPATALTNLPNGNNGGGTG